MTEKRTNTSKPAYGAPFRPVGAQNKHPRRRYATPAQRRIIYQRDNGKCQACGAQVPFKGFHADHKKAFVLGGPTTIENLQVLCGRCNSKKGKKVWRPKNSELREALAVGGCLTIFVIGLSLLALVLGILGVL